MLNTVLTVFLQPCKGVRALWVIKDRRGTCIGVITMVTTVLLLLLINRKQDSVGQRQQPLVAFGQILTGVRQFLTT